LPSSSPVNASASRAQAWSPDSWRERPAAQAATYADEARLRRVVESIRALPPLVTSYEIENLRTELAEAQEGRRFVLQGGDCAELLAECRPEIITNKLKILLQMSLVLVHGGRRPVVRIGRFAGQYAKPRSSPTERRGGEELPSYFGDLVNRPGFSSSDREPDPELMLEAYKHAAMTLNFVRSLVDHGFADLHHPEHWDLSFFEHADLPADLAAEYRRTSESLSEALRFLESLGEAGIDEITRVGFYTSHEGLNLEYESAQTRQVPRREGWYDLSTHLPWIGERTRDLGGAHIEFFRGIRNPVGVKIGPAADPAEVVELARTLNPRGERGKVALITRMGADRAAEALPPILEALASTRTPALWLCDPMHGNTRATESGVKTRRFDDIIAELEAVMDAHDRVGTWLGGVHFELTGEDVTECVGGGAGVTEQDLTRRYTSLCDPRLNYAQALEMAFRLARRMRGSGG
jgi:3-deoxy-7-phosphoheptulonate synthase